jgi:integrase
MDKKGFLIWCAVKRHLSQGSLLTTRLRYEYLFKWLGNKKLTSSAAEEFVLHLREKGSKNATINSYIRVFKLIDLYERENGQNFDLLHKISYFPKVKKAPSILEPEEIAAILRVRIDYTHRPGVSKRTAALLDEIMANAVWMLAATGCRFTEMAKLKVEDLELGINSGWVTFKDTKTNVDRRVPLPPAFIKRLEPYIASKNPGDILFPSTTGRQMIEQTFNPNLRKRVQEAGIINKHVHAHMFRYSFITEHHKRKTDLFALMRLVGHEDPKTTLGYTAHIKDQLQEAAQNHFLWSESIPTKTLLNKGVEAIKKVFDQDRRFTVSTKVSEEQISIVVEVRSGVI